jgi:cation:H+ antiporter
MTIEILQAVGQFILGFIFLVAGAEALVRGASRLALRWNVPPVIIGLTVVAFGTSLPELMVTVTANLQTPGGSPMAIGNVVGSNIANIGLILALCALVLDLAVHRQVLHVEYPMMLVASFLFLVFSLTGNALDRGEGALLVIGLLGFVGWDIYAARRHHGIQRTGEEILGAAAAVDPEVGRPSIQLGFDVLLIVVGLGGLLIGAEWLVDGAQVIARALGVSEMLIGLTLVAVGTSLPEAATGLIASFRKQRDLAVGNVVGSNLFNILGIAGISALLKPLPVPTDSWPSFLAMILFALVAFAMIFRRPHMVKKWHAAVLLIMYAGYIVLLVTGMGA